MDQDFMGQWAAVRTRGCRRFALTRGVLLWGGLMTLGMLLGHWLAGRWHVVVFGFLVVSLSAGGFFLGCSIWNHNEKKFAEIKCRNDERSASPAH